jgi:hypothetical protein
MQSQAVTGRVRHDSRQSQAVAGTVRLSRAVRGRVRQQRQSQAVA